MGRLRISPVTFPSTRCRGTIRDCRSEFDGPLGIASSRLFPSSTSCEYQHITKVPCRAVCLTASEPSLSVSARGCSLRTFGSRSSSPKYINDRQPTALQLGATPSVISHNISDPYRHDPVIRMERRRGGLHASLRDRLSRFYRKSDSCLTILHIPKCHRCRFGH